MNVIEKKRSSFAEWSGVGVVLTKKFFQGMYTKRLETKERYNKATYSFHQEM